MISILKYLSKREWGYVGISIVFIVLQVWLDLKLPSYMSAITTLVETSGSKMSDTLLQGGYMLLCALGSMAAATITGYLVAKVAAGLSRTLRSLTYNQILDFSNAEIGHFSTASLINRSTNDIVQIQNLVAMGLQAIVKAPIMAIWALTLIIDKSWQWTASTGIAVLVLVVMLALVLLVAVPRYRRVQSLTDNLNRVTREQLTGIRVVWAYNAEQYEEEKFDQANDELTNNNLVANRVMALMSPTMTLINSGLTLAIYWIGAYLIEAASLSSKLPLFSDMVVFSNYAMQVIMAFMLLNMIFILLPRAQVSAKRIIQVLTTPISIQDGQGGAPKRQGQVEFKHVSFTYPGSQEKSLSDVSFTVEAGSTLAIIGATGSGKTTLVNLINRLYDVTDGQVLVDGQDVRDYQLAELRQRVALAPQKATLFKGTIASNVSYGDRGTGEISSTQIDTALAAAQATEFVQQKAEGINEPISQGGTNVSGGQRQRLSIARSLAGNAEIMIFDDTFSALDYRTDAQLRHDLNQEFTQETKIIVAQRIGTIRDADQILVLDHGKIVGQGTHEELLANSPEYLEIAESQLSPDELKK
ncbi:ATP-binding cassette domain-containing protein [Limosilactobacillus gastricus]|uniref:Multidrug resistance ABC superfamily ATP binding cassette transporter, ABC membrane protein n=1 Tax=Limosilactobacillus gastricus DSM 16045 TaxID=1423749 RepID=A0A0R1V741_9LACO|nr:ABC transporter ATP-binding protein [Limosilactobacillus gastricus]KRM01326.1 Multidrug resistance ABC superfamily ATP binding cassette transporter, ABC membrane protein [Limosilactobacillus gastricus DSM 16045]QGF40937.1 ATP-binding cassette domain-containing protein [Limosilactobacillus gastricus]